MAELINLRLARKAAARGKAQAVAATNRAKFSQTKGDRLRQAQDEARLRAGLDGALRLISEDEG